MKKVLAKDLKVGDVVCDTPFSERKFSVEHIFGSILFLIEITNTHYYQETKDGYAIFDYGDTIWYMED